MFNYIVLAIFKTLKLLKVRVFTILFIHTYFYSRSMIIGDIAVTSKLHLTS